MPAFFRNSITKIAEKRRKRKQKRKQEGDKKRQQALTGDNKKDNTNRHEKQAKVNFFLCNPKNLCNFAC